MGSSSHFSIVVLTGAALVGCGVLGGGDDDIDDVTGSEVRGQVLDNRGQPVAGATVRLFDLGDNTNFVEGGDIQSASAYIDREVVIASDNAVAVAQTDAEGRFVIDDATPSAFLASVVVDGCTAGFAGFDEETGVLNVDTLLVPNFDDGLRFDIPTFTIACATPPTVGPDGNSDEAPPYDPPVAAPTCDDAECAAAGGACDGNACAITCAVASCEASGGSCVDGACQLAACNEEACADAGGMCADDRCELTAACDATACEAARGTCSGDGTSCDIPPCFAADADCNAEGGSCSADGATCDFAACSSDADCEAGQAGAYCTDAGDVALAACHPPEPGEIVTPPMPQGWTDVRLSDINGNVLADASSEDQVVAANALPSDRVVRLQAAYDGDATTMFVHVQTGDQSCPDMPPSTDSVAVELVGGAATTSEGDFVDLVLHGGTQKIQLSTSEVLGEGERSHVIEVGGECDPPATTFTAILDWTAGPGMPADLDLSVWNAAGDLVFIGNKQAAWGQLPLDSKGPGPEVFEAIDASQGPFTIKVEFFSGRPRDIQATLRIIRTMGTTTTDENFSVLLSHPKDIAEVGVFTAQ